MSQEDIDAIFRDQRRRRQEELRKRNAATARGESVPDHREMGYKRLVEGAVEEDPLGVLLPPDLREKVLDRIRQDGGQVCDIADVRVVGSAEEASTETEPAEQVVVRPRFDIWEQGT